MTNSLKGKGSFPTTLLTGGAGFLGSHLCDRLIREGHEVICMDTLLTGRMENIRHLLPHPRFRFIHHDITQRINLPSLSRNRAGQRGPLKIKYVVHLASPESHEDYGRRCLHALKIEALGCYHTLGLAKAHGSVYLLASTPEVRGVRQAESHGDYSNAREPFGTYDEGKRFAESIVLTYHREQNVKVRIARIFDTYGERMPVGNRQGLSNFVVQALQGRPLTVHGDGSQTRSFCYVSDLIEGLYKLLLSQETAPVDLGNPEEHSVQELVATIIELLRSKSRIVFEGPAINDPVRGRPDTSKATKILKWHPKVGLLDGIRRVIPYFRLQMADCWLHSPDLAWKRLFHGEDKYCAQNN